MVRISYPIFPVDFPYFPTPPITQISRFSNINRVSSKFNTFHINIISTL
ncbi:hypothetical protein HanXRQr2_Chr17g0805121 [Helianthus annuus]|uniref:Uncharacterized protein n=1 Tax=Helianthus annuus TaxID=4232 RepID=A0A9K3DHJ6_HELAN|nr:hypothetical protein HanXRQr2_Chr17g0805121 [Helianthus annuus]